VGFDRQINNSSVELLSLHFNDRSFSFQNLLQQQLLIATRKYLELNITSIAINSSLLLDNISRVPLHVNHNIDRYCYRSAISFCLSSQLRLSPSTIARHLAENMAKLEEDYRETIDRKTLKFAVNSNDSGWLDFYLEDRSIAIWLDRLSYIDLPIFCPTAVIAKNTFILQYSHARSRSLLDLATRQKIFDRSIGERENIYLSNDNYLIFQEDTELSLILNLLQIVDLLLEQNHSKKLLNAALCLSEAFLNFHDRSPIFNPRDCQNYQLIQARLRSIEKVNFILEKILKCLAIEPLISD
jgi:hypothetical protein